MIRKPNFKLNWKYALGEIALIFIGITAAIWFNNWNERQKDRELEKHFYGLIITDMEATLDDLEDALQMAKIRIIAGNNLLGIINQEHQDIFLLEDMSIDSLWSKRYFEFFDHLSPLSRDLFYCRTVQVIDARTAGFVEITSSGKLQAIRDDQLRSDIVTTYEQLEDWSESNTFFRGAMERYSDNMEAAGIALQDMRSDDLLIKLMKQSPTFQASIRSLMATGYEQQMTYSTMISFIEDFMAKIQQVVKNPK